MLTKRIVGQNDEDVEEYGYTYNPLNQLTEFEDAEGNVTTYAYDGTVIADYEYTYDIIGNQTRNKSRFFKKSFGYGNRTAHPSDSKHGKCIARS